MKHWIVSLQGMKLAKLKSTLTQSDKKESVAMHHDYLALAIQKMDRTIARMKSKTHIVLLRTDYLE